MDLQRFYKDVLISPGKQFYLRKYAFYHVNVKRYETVTCFFVITRQINVFDNILVYNVFVIILFFSIFSRYLSV